jgi:hypothetical protein
MQYVIRRISQFWEKRDCFFGHVDLDWEGQNIDMCAGISDQRMIVGKIAIA